MAKKQKAGVEVDIVMTKFIAIVIRNAMEDFHVEHLTDMQMKELNQIIRNAVFTALQALRHAPESDGARAFIGFQTALIPDYWEDPRLLDDYVGGLKLKDEKELSSANVTERKSKIGARDLKVGAKYLHRNGHFVRTIERIEGHVVHWSDQFGYGSCSKSTFLTQCPSIAPE